MNALVPSDQNSTIGDPVDGTPQHSPSSTDRTSGVVTTNVGGNKSRADIGDQGNFESLMDVDQSTNEAPTLQQEIEQAIAEGQLIDVPNEEALLYTQTLLDEGPKEADIRNAREQLFILCCAIGGKNAPPSDHFQLTYIDAVEKVAELVCRIAGFHHLPHQNTTVQAWYKNYPEKSREFVERYRRDVIEPKKKKEAKRDTKSSPDIIRGSILSGETKRSLKEAGYSEEFINTLGTVLREINVRAFIVGSFGQLVENKEDTPPRRISLSDIVIAVVESVKDSPKKSDIDFFLREIEKSIVTHHLPLSNLPNASPWDFEALYSRIALQHGIQIRPFLRETKKAAIPDIGKETVREVEIATKRVYSGENVGDLSELMYLVQSPEREMPNDMGTLQVRDIQAARQEFRNYLKNISENSAGKNSDSRAPDERTSGEVLINSEEKPTIRSVILKAAIAGIPEKSMKKLIQALSHNFSLQDGDKPIDISFWDPNYEEKTNTTREKTLEMRKEQSIQIQPEPPVHYTLQDATPVQERRQNFTVPTETEVPLKTHPVQESSQPEKQGSWWSKTKLNPKNWGKSSKEKK